jgi:quercetin dioxygenase-like cupin family protein
MGVLEGRDMQTTIETRPLRFLDTVVRVHVRHDQGMGGVSIIESWAAHGDSPPLHVHRTEDESFYVLEGTIRLNVAGHDVVLSAGDCALAPSDTPHTYRVESEGGARWLVITSAGDFERFVLALSAPAEDGAVPSLSGPPSEEQENALADVAGAYGIDLVGPPLG